MIEAIMRRLKGDAGLDNVDNGSVQARWTLLYGGLSVAKLQFDGNSWSFEYTDEFKAQSVLKPFPDFPQVELKYTSQEPWAFLLSRLPSPSRADISKILLQEGIESDDLVSLLNQFGRHSVSSPFELIAA